LEDLKMWYRIYVECRSLERFEVEAACEDEALVAYDSGEATLCADEVQERTVRTVKPVATQQEETR
jgi:hypothetical protein